MATQEIQIWSQNLIYDPVASNLQRRDINQEEWNEGWLRQYGVSAQQMNQLMYLFSAHAAPSDICPYLFPTSGTIPAQALEMNGQAITSGDSPELFNTYGANLPDLTGDAPTGFTYIVRNH